MRSTWRAWPTPTAPRPVSAPSSPAPISCCSPPIRRAAIDAMAAAVDRGEIARRAARPVGPAGARGQAPARAVRPADGAARQRPGRRGQRRVPGRRRRDRPALHRHGEGLGRRHPRSGERAARAHAGDLRGGGEPDGRPGARGRAQGAGVRRHARAALAGERRARATTRPPWRSAGARPRCSPPPTGRSAAAARSGCPPRSARSSAGTARERPTILVSLGNPYITRGLPEVGSYLIALALERRRRAGGGARARRPGADHRPAADHPPARLSPRMGPPAPGRREPPPPLPSQGLPMHLVFSDWLIIVASTSWSPPRSGWPTPGRPASRSTSISSRAARCPGGWRARRWWRRRSPPTRRSSVAGLVAKYGVAGNWLWWNGAFSGVLTVFFFSRLWRRAGVLTDVEFAELRYGGKPAAALRGFRALYLALPINLIIMGWVTRAMVTILQITPRHRIPGRPRSSCSASRRSTASSRDSGASS